MKIGKRKIKKRNTVLLILLGLLGIVLLPRVLFIIESTGRIKSVENVKQQNVCIVFGAGLRSDGTPTPMLKDRIQTAAALYQTGKVKKILLSGHADPKYYNEPEAMKRTALEMGVPARDLLLDTQGSRTFDTIVRAKELYDVQSAILVTQRYHMDRALKLADSYGISAEGVPANSKNGIGGNLKDNLRETAACVRAVWDIIKDKPVMNEKNDIAVSNIHNQVYKSTER